MELTNKFEKVQKSRAMLAGFFGFALIVVGFFLEESINHFYQLIGFISGHVGIAFLVAAVIFFSYEIFKGKEEGEKLKLVLQKVKEDVFDASIGAFVPDSMKKVLVTILKNTDFIKQKYVARFILKMDSSTNAIQSYDQIVEYTVKNTTNDIKEYPIRIGNSWTDEQKHHKPICKINGIVQKLTKAKKPSLIIGENSCEYNCKISVGPQESVKVVVHRVFEYVDPQSKITLQTHFIEPCEDIKVKISADEELNKYFNIGIAAFSSGEFLLDKNIIHKNHRSYDYSGCMIPYQGFSLTILTTKVKKKISKKKKA